MGRRWDPELELQRVAPDARVVYRDLQHCRGMVRLGPPPEVSLHYLLGRRERRVVLAHEVKHLQLQLFYGPSTPPALVAKLEAVVRRATADELVPIDELAAWVATRMDPVTARDVADYFDVTIEVALEQMRRLVHRDGREDD